MKNAYELKKASKGVICPLVTWLDENGAPDLEAMGKHIITLLKKGLDGGIFVTGSTGEGPYLTFEEKKAIMARAVNVVKGKVPVLAGIAAFGTKEAIEFGLAAQEAGVDAIMAIVPQYFDLTPAELETYYRRVHDGVGKMNLCMYYAPTIITCSPQVDAELVFRLAKDKVICGIKDTVSDWQHVAAIHDLLKTDYTAECNVWVGTDQALIDCLKNEEPDTPSFDGLITSAANMFPDFYRSLVKAFREPTRNDVRCAALEKASEIIRAMFSVQKREIPSLVKQALNFAGVPYAASTAVSSPLPDLNPDAAAIIADSMAQLKKRGIEP
jgi:4-hydroxy-tetrahydrodipicolinate synthase